ncbi:hypothetical protein ACN28I_34400 [Archangium gephyra]|uniref:hypothetical protein n=1 Tax=Archangium gephyra TaxID=48 RepID=UPI003B7ACDEC
MLENLGVQTLLATTGTFGTCDLIISDAGAREHSWKPGEVIEPLKTFGMAALSAAHLVRVTLTMNNKQNRSMRSLTMRELEASWLCDQLRNGSSGDPVRTAFLEDRPALPRRKLLFVRLEQDLDSLLSQISTWRLTELWMRSNPGQPMPVISRTGSRKDPKSVREFLEKANVDLREAIRIHEALGPQRIQQLQDIPTHFTALAPRDVEGLAEHARWQLHAMRAIYW